MTSQDTFQTFRRIAKIEGISFLVLLFIAMPMKYIGGMPLAVRIVGSMHGIFFIAFMIYMYLVNDQYDKNVKWMLRAFLASIIPFGTFVMDKQWKSEQLAAGN